MLKLYGSARSRAAIVQWYLEEQGIPYEFVQLDLAAGDNTKPDYLAIHPLGKVPAIADGDFTLWESGAILLYLADQYAQSPITVEQRAILSQWVLYANASLGPEVFSEATREKALPRHMTMLNHHLSDRAYMLGDEFSLADVAVGSMLTYTQLMLKVDVTPYPAIVAYGDRLAARPAFQACILGRK